MSGTLRPTFIVIGAQKCGTTALFTYLSEHPSIAPPQKKEIHYFLAARIHARGPGFYHSHFPEARDDAPGLVTFEASPNYLTSADAARWIREYDPAMRLVVLLRDPIERAYSAWQMYRRIRAKNPSWFFDWVAECDAERGRDFYVPRGEGFGRDFAADVEQELEALERGRVVELPILRHGMYAEQLESWFRRFPREQFFIESNERLSGETGAVLRELEDFVGLPHHDWDDSALAPIFVGDYERRVPEKAAVLLARTYAESNERLFTLLGRRFPWS